MRATLLRDIGGRLGEVSEASKDDPAKLRQELEQLRAELAAESRSEEQRAAQVAASQANWKILEGIRAGLERQPRRPQAGHFYDKRDDTVRLYVTDAGTAAPLFCEVTPPNGDPSIALVQGRPQTVGGADYQIKFPADFADSARVPQVPGTYHVAWYYADPRGDDQLIPIVNTPMATDTFTLV